MFSKVRVSHIHVSTHAVQIHSSYGGHGVAARDRGDAGVSVCAQSAMLRALDDVPSHAPIPVHCDIRTLSAAVTTPDVALPCIALALSRQHGCHSRHARQVMRSGAARAICKAKAQTALASLVHHVQHDRWPTAHSNHTYTAASVD